MRFNAIFLFFLNFEACFGEIYGVKDSTGDDDDVLPAVSESSHL